MTTHEIIIESTQIDRITASDYKYDEGLKWIGKSRRFAWKNTEISKENGKAFGKIWNLLGKFEFSLGNSNLALLIVKLLKLIKLFILLHMAVVDNSDPIAKSFS